MANNVKSSGKKLQLNLPEMSVGIAISALGLVLTIWPGLASSVVFNAIGIIGIIIGTVHLVRYFMLDSQAAMESRGMFIGLMWLVGGILLMALKGFLLSLLPVLFGLVLLVGGIGKLQYALNFKRMGAARWYLELAGAILSIAFGAIILINPFGTALLLMRIVGIAILIEGAQDLVSSYAYRKTREAYFVKFKDE